jgi:hypothetical protein
MAAVTEDRELLPSYTDHGGYRMPKGFPVEGFISGLTYQAQPNDLFVATYPKCGTTLMQHLVYLILNNGKPLEAEERLDQIFPHLEEVGADFAANYATILDRYRLIKTHFPYSKTPQHDNAKYIFVARNPKDCVVSFFHHTRGFENHYNFANGSFDTYFQLFLEGKVDFGCYFSMLRSWMDHKDDPNVLFLTYEELRKNTRQTVLSVAAFLDADIYPQKLVANDDELMEQVLSHSSLDNMKKDPMRWSSDRPKQHAPFIRNGSVGGWGELLQPERAVLLDERMKVTFTEKELDYLGDKYFSF